MKLFLYFLYSTSSGGGPRVVSLGPVAVGLGPIGPIVSLGPVGIARVWERPSAGQGSKCLNRDGYTPVPIGSSTECPRVCVCGHTPTHTFRVTAIYIYTYTYTYEYSAMRFDVHL